MDDDDDIDEEDHEDIVAEAAERRQSEEEAARKGQSSLQVPHSIGFAQLEPRCRGASPNKALRQQAGARALS